MSTTRRVRRVLPLAAFLALGSFGITMLVTAEWGHARVRERERMGRETRYDWRVVSLPILEHLGSALIVAALMGLTYEYFVHKHVIDDFELLLKEHERTTDERLDALQATTAHEVFGLIGNIAARATKIPTLYEPARDNLSEVVFATDVAFFRSVIGTNKARGDAIKTIDGWLDSAKLNLRFLGSDFAGLLQLHELETRLRDLASEWEAKWDDLKDPERGCVLNFYWAASRCETPMYESLLRRLVRARDDAFTQEWILFVPRQMPDARWGQMIDTFVRARRGDDDHATAVLVIAAIRRLHAANVNMKPVVKRHHRLFEKHGLWPAACDAIGVANAGSGAAKSRVGRALRVLGRFSPFGR